MSKTTLSATRMMPHRLAFACNLLVCCTVASSQLFDAIIVGAGGGGCPLAQTLVEGGKKVLLLERGPERPPITENIADVAAVLRDEACVETFSSRGIEVGTGKCMGGATSYNQGIWIEEEPSWVKRQMETLLPSGQDFFDIETIAGAFEWVRERVAPDPAAEVPGSAAAEHVTAVFDAMEEILGLDRTDMEEGQSRIPSNGGIWRPHSIFDPTTGTRRAADTLLDRADENLVVRTDTEVDRIVFDVGRRRATRRLQGIPPRARCVLLVGGEEICVVDGGKIFLAAGAFHTPELLMKSGIGPEGELVVNDQVGQNLQDKPMFFTFGFLRPEVDYTELVTVGHAAAIDVRRFTRLQIPRSVLTEHVSSGIFASFFDLLAFERGFVPTPLRTTRFTDRLVSLLDECPRLFLTGNETIPPECEPFVPFINATCNEGASILANLVSDPSSTGSVRIGRGGLEVDTNVLSTLVDIQAYGRGIRASHAMMSAIQGPTAIQAPCADPEDTECIATSCPDLFAAFEADLGGIFGALPSPPIVAVFPSQIEARINSGFGDLALGLSFKTSAISPHHFAGSARVGDVLTRDFQVLGTENLYVADASALPKTPRVNAMPSAMMIGRLVGISVLEDWM